MKYRAFIRPGHDARSALHGRITLLACLIAFAGLPSNGDSNGPVLQAIPPETWRGFVESNWLAAEHVRAAIAKPGAVSTESDAAGGCDGVINGEWGFHTGLASEPWWQVDLGQSHRIARVVVWNRCQASERAARLMLLSSDDGKDWRTVYRHDGTVFYGFTDQKPLVIGLVGESARFLRIQLPGSAFLHLEEVQVFGADAPEKNLALHRKADQVSTSQWSYSHDHAQAAEPYWDLRARKILALSAQRAGELRQQGLEVGAIQGELAQLATRLGTEPKEANRKPDHYLAARRIQRRLALENPLLDFDTILFAKRVPGSFNHMSDQYYGWFSKPGGGLYLLRGFKTDHPTVECLTTGFKADGSFLRPTLSYDGKKVLFAWCRYYPELAAEADKLNKTNVPEDAFYHLFEIELDGSGLRQLTRGKYDDFDGRYLPDGRIVFLSTRRGQFIQAGRQSAACTEKQADLPDIYVRCGGGPERPVAVYTLHTMDADGGNLIAISPFEMFEWTPEIHHDGTILHSRWDYIDRDNMPYMGLWSLNPDGTNPRIVYGNHTKAPHCAFEPKPIPGSRKIVFTASAHHAQTMGSLVLLDPSAGTEGNAPITRLTPEIPFPEIEAWPKTSYASPWPLSERFYLVAWGHEGASVPGPEGWNRWHAVKRPDNGMALYLFDAVGGRELLYLDPQIACLEPIPVRPRPKPPVHASPALEPEGKEGRLLLANVYNGLNTVSNGEIKSLRIVAVPPKTHPTMNFPSLGITRDDPGKCVLGTVPVERDGSAYFRLPAGVIVFFQALDQRGVALQTMRTVTHVQPGQTLACAGCHENRHTAPLRAGSMASRREPSRIMPGPQGSWPLRFSELVQPVIDRHCVECHNPKHPDVQAAKYDLTPAKAYESLVAYGKPSLADQVWTGYRRGYSVERDGLADRSALLSLLSQPDGHYEVKLDKEDWERLITWMDAYAQRAGSFNEAQEEQLHRLKEACFDLLESRPGHPLGMRAADRSAGD